MSELRRSVVAVGACIGLAASLPGSSENPHALAEQHRQIGFEQLHSDHLAIARFGNCAIRSAVNGPLDGSSPGRRELQVGLTLAPTPEASQAMHRYESNVPVYWIQGLVATMHSPQAPNQKVEGAGLGILPEDDFAPVRTLYPLANQPPGTEMTISLKSSAAYDGPAVYNTGALQIGTTRITTTDTIPCGTLTLGAAGNWAPTPPSASPTFQNGRQEVQTIIAVG